MRAALALALVLGLATLPGCFGPLGTPSSHTIGDQGHAEFLISDGLCGGGLFGTDCALSQRVASAAAVRVIVHEHGTPLAGATIVTGGTGSVTGFSTSTDEHGVTTLSATVAHGGPGVTDVVVDDAAGHEIDRAHVTFVDVTALACGELRMSQTRVLDFPGLVTGATVALTPDSATPGTSTAVLACRATDAAGDPVLTVDAIRWTVASGPTGAVTVRSDDLLGTTPARGATVRVSAMDHGGATIRAALGAATADVNVTF